MINENTPNAREQHQTALTDDRYTESINGKRCASGRQNEHVRWVSTIHGGTAPAARFVIGGFLQHKMLANIE